MKPRLTFIIDNLRLGGAQVHLYNLTKGMREIGYHDPEVISMSGEGEVYDWMVKSGITVRNFRMKSIWQPVFHLDLARLILHLAKGKPDIVHTYLDTANVFGVIAAKCAGVSRIMTSRRDLGVFRSRLIEVLIGRLSNRIEKVICVCTMAAKECTRREKLVGNNVMVIPNGIDVGKYSLVYNSIRGGGPLFCNIAVPDRVEKGHADLIAAFALVLASLPQARLRLVGDGELLPDLKRQALEMGLTDGIEFFGSCYDIPAVMKDVTAFVLPSHSEGISNALLEAMSMGIPAVVTAVGGNPDVVVDGETGVLVEPRNPESIARGMLGIVKDSARLLAMGRAAHERAKSEFSFEAMIRRYDSLYCGATSWQLSSLR